MPDAAARPAPRRSDADHIRLTARDITGLLLCADHYAAPYDLLATALDVQPARLRGIVARWRAAGYAVTGALGPGPAWCWLTPAGMTACGPAWPARPPALARLAHVRAVLAARLWLQAAPGYAEGGGWWGSERRNGGTRPHPARSAAGFRRRRPGRAEQTRTRASSTPRLTPRPRPAPRKVADGDGTGTPRTAPTSTPPGKTW